MKNKKNHTLYILYVHLNRQHIIVLVFNHQNTEIQFEKGREINPGKIAFNVYIQYDSLCRSLLSLFPSLTEFSISSMPEIFKEAQFLEKLQQFALFVIGSHGILWITSSNCMLMICQSHLLFLFCSPNVEMYTWALKSVNNKRRIAIHEWINLKLTTRCNINNVVGIEHITAVTTMSTLVVTFSGEKPGFLWYRGKRLFTSLLFKVGALLKLMLGRSGRASLRTLSLEKCPNFFWQFICMVTILCHKV